MCVSIERCDQHWDFKVIVHMLITLSLHKTNVKFSEDPLSALLTRLEVRVSNSLPPPPLLSNLGRRWGGDATSLLYPRGWLHQAFGIDDLKPRYGMENQAPVVFL